MKRTKSEARICKDGRTRMIPRRRTHEESVAFFWSLVERKSVDDCWPWKGPIKSEKWPYGKVWDGTNEVKAHRFSFKIHYGQIPFGLDICHKCDNPICVNPRHLFAGTRGDNNRDACNKGRHLVGEDCPQTILTEHSVREIRMLHIPRVLGYRKLARKYGVSESCIQGIIERRTWRHVP